MALVILILLAILVGGVGAAVPFDSAVLGTGHQPNFTPSFGNNGHHDHGNPNVPEPGGLIVLTLGLVSFVGSRMWRR